MTTTKTEIRPITIIGCGPGARDSITLAGLQAIEQAGVLVGARRLLDTFKSNGQECIAVTADIEGALEAIAHRMNQGGIAVLVTGDPGVSSLARPVLRRFGRPACTVIPGVSSIQTAFARLGLDWLDARLITAHGRMPGMHYADLMGCPKIAVLAGSGPDLAWAADLAERLDRHKVYICQDLTLSTEDVRQATAPELRNALSSSRTIVIFVKEGLFP